MKNLHVLLLLMAVIITGVMVPVQPTKAWGSGVPLVTECFHATNGVIDSAPYIVLMGAGTCPPCDSNETCRNSLAHKDHKDLPEMPPNECTEIGVEEW